MKYPPKIDEWVDITEKVTVEIEGLGGDFCYLQYKHENRVIGYSKTEGSFVYINEEDYRVEWEDNDFQILKKI